MKVSEAMQAACDEIWADPLRSRAAQRLAVLAGLILDLPAVVQVIDLVLKIPEGSLWDDHPEEG